MFRRVLACIVVAAAVAVGASPAAASGHSRSGGSKPTIAGIVSKSGGTFDHNRYDYDVLLTAVKAAGLVGALDDPSARLTVFAPNDRAFIRLAQDLGYSGWDEAGAWDHLVGALTDLGGGDPIPVLTQVLQYHVVPGVYRTFDVILARELPTLLGPTIGVRLIQLVDKDPDIRNPYLNVFALDQRASNGVVHGITRVLLPVNV